MSAKEVTHICPTCNRGARVATSAPVYFIYALMFLIILLMIYLYVRYLKAHTVAETCLSVRSSMKS